MSKRTAVPVVSAVCLSLRPSVVGSGDDWAQLNTSTLDWSPGATDRPQTDKHRARAMPGQPLWVDRSCPLPCWTRPSSGLTDQARCRLFAGRTNARVALSCCQLCSVLSVAEIQMTESSFHPHPPTEPPWALSETILWRFRCPVIFITSSTVSCDTTEIHNAPTRRHKAAFCPRDTVAWDFFNSNIV